MEFGAYEGLFMIYIVLTMAMLVGLLMDVKDPGKVRNQRVEKSQIVLVIIIIIIINLNLILVKNFYFTKAH